MNEKSIPVSHGSFIQFYYGSNVRVYLLEKKTLFGTKLFGHEIFFGPKFLGPIILKGTLKWSEIFSYMKEGGTLTTKIKSKSPAEPLFSFK